MKKAKAQYKQGSMRNQSLRPKHACCSIDAYKHTKPCSPKPELLTFRIPKSHDPPVCQGLVERLWPWHHGVDSGRNAQASNHGNAEK